MSGLILKSRDYHKFENSTCHGVIDLTEQLIYLVNYLGLA